jgi:hypothetical protein
MASSALAPPAPTSAEWSREDGVPTGGRSISGSEKTISPQDRGNPPAERQPPLSCCSLAKRLGCASPRQPRKLAGARPGRPAGRASCGGLPW